MLPRFFSMAAVALSTAIAAATPVYPPFGLDLSARDPSVRPGASFFDYANGAYLARTPIPNDQARVNRRYEGSLRTERQMHEMMEAAAQHAATSPDDLEGKVGTFYAAFLDEAMAERTGAAPLAPELTAIRSASDREGLAALMGQPGLYPAPFNCSFDPDLRNPRIYATSIAQGGLGLPDRDYYLKPEFTTQRAAYRAYATTLLRLVGWPDPEASADAALAFETAIARASWTNVEMRDPTARYHPVTPEALAAYAPGFAWQPYFKSAGLDAKRTLVLTTDTAVPKIAALVAATPLPALKAWMAFRVADTAAPYLSANFANASFELRGRAVNGQAEQKPRWRRAIQAAAGGHCFYGECFGTLAWGASKLYADRYFPAETKAKIEALVANLKLAFRARMERLDWMAPTTKTEALRKLDALIVKVGYPEMTRNYAGVAIRRDDLLGNVRRSAAYEAAFQVRRSQGPVDRNDWSITAQTNDAYTSGLLDVVFPAAILQAPIFDPAADPAINYGAIGGIIGHELTHNFDDEGRHTDARGILRDWWTPEDAAAFKARAAVLGAQFARYEPLPGIHINPDLTMGENLADLGGLSIALDAYHASLKGRPAPVLAGLTGDQRVFLGWAQAFAGKWRPEAIRRLTASDPHSYSPFRVNGIVRNIDAWYAAWEIRPGDPLYVAPEKRARVW